MTARICVAIVLCVWAAAIFPARAETLPWRITKTEWSAADEKGFGEFIRAIADSGCTTSVACMRGPGNPYRSSDPASLAFHADCAKWVYMLRAYYASKNGLPFSYVDKISGEGADIRFSATSNHALSRHDLVDQGKGIPTEATLYKIHNQVWSATYRMDPNAEDPVIQDFYSPKIQPGSIRAGTAIYDINGHVGIVYDVTPDGRILYMDAHPDESVSRSVYGPQFGQSAARLGGGFKDFRPLKLVGATRQPGGTLVGGHVVLARNQDIADFSLEQYRGNVQEARGDGPDAHFAYNNASLGLFEYARASMSGGNFAFNPGYELQVSMQSLCHEVRERALHVNMAQANGIPAKAQPSRLPGNSAQSDDAEWAAYATLPADARMRNSFVQLYRNLARMISPAQQQDARIVRDRGSLREHLQETYGTAANACSITYINSDNKPVTLDLNEVAKRLFTLDFDPYHCIERRWGATSREELASCKDNEVKSRWYKAEQNLRNQVDAGYVMRQAVSLPEIEKAPQYATPAVDVRALIEGTDQQASLVGTKSAGL